MDDHTQPEYVDRRLRYFDGQFLREQDFIAEQQYHLDRERRLARVAHTAGVVEGPEGAEAAGEVGVVLEHLEEGGVDGGVGAALLQDAAGAADPPVVLVELEVDELRGGHLREVEGRDPGRALIGDLVDAAVVGVGVESVALADVVPVGDVDRSVGTIL